jgi:hypothetical protein
MSSSKPTRLLTTRTRSAVALGLTGVVFALALRDIFYASHPKSGWLFSSTVTHGWPWIALSVFFYGYLCGLAFWSIRGTEGTERIFVVGWFVGIPLSPLGMLHAHWSPAIAHIAAIGLGIALLAALALLLKRSAPQADAT